MNTILKFLKFLEDPKHPCLGPHLRLLKLTGIWHPDLHSRLARIKLLLFYIIIAFFITQYIKCLISLDFDHLKLILQYAPFHMGVVKTCFFQKDYKKWQRLINYVSSQELQQLSKKVKNQNGIIRDYIHRSRRVTYFFWGLAIFSNFNIFSEPYQKNYVGGENGTSVYLYLFDGYTPFKKEPPGYYWSMFIQTVIGHMMSAYIVGWDMLTVSIMIFFAGQLRISRYYCKRAIDLESREISQNNIVECHRFHTTLVQYQMEFNDLIKSVMCFYLIIISVNLGVCIIQIAEIENDKATLASSVVYIIACLVQLLLFYWHGNEVTVESEKMSYSTFKCQWVDSDWRLQKQVALLALTTRKKLVLSAGPLNKMSLSTFISILRSSYSFYTLLKGTS